MRHIINIIKKVFEKLEKRMHLTDEQRTFKLNV